MQGNPGHSYAGEPLSGEEVERNVARKVNRS